MDLFDTDNERYNSKYLNTSALFDSTEDKTPIADPLSCDSRMKTFSPTPTNNNNGNFFKQGMTPSMRLVGPSNSSTPRSACSEINKPDESSTFNSLKTNDTSETSGIGSTNDDSDQLINNILSNLKGYNALPNLQSNQLNFNIPQGSGSNISTQSKLQQQSSYDSILDNYGLQGLKESDLSLEDLLYLKQRNLNLINSNNNNFVSPTSAFQSEKLNELLQQEEQKYKNQLNEKLSQNLLQQLLTLNAQQTVNNPIPCLTQQLLSKQENNLIDKNLLSGFNKNVDLLKLLGNLENNNNSNSNNMPLLSNYQNNSPDLMNDVNNMTLYYKFIYGAPENEIEKAAYLYRNSANSVAQRGEERAQWTGNVTKSINSNVIFSRKVFLGGVPWDITTDELICTFKIYGDLSVHWPNRDGGSSVPAAPHSRAPKAGYCYLLFESDIGVKRLMDHCSKLGNLEGYYYRMRSPKFKQKEVQVIPWVVSDSTYQRNLNVRIDNKKTVFVGALHGMITAEMLFTIMDTLFSNVVFAALDTDKYKYPIGSGRVSFNAQTSYLNAVTTNFVDVQTSRFNKTIQIDPYLEDSMCNHCFVQPGIYFCRSFECFRYFCPSCWNLWHNKSLLINHKPLRRSFKCVSSSNSNQLSELR